MSFYIFQKTGDYEGIRLTRPTDQETDLIGIESTPENLAKMSVFVTPKLIDGEIIEAATPEQIAQAKKDQVPVEVALWKLRHVLSIMQLEDLVSAAIENLQEPLRGAAIKLWNFGNSVERYSPTVSLIKQVLNIDDNQADDIFIEADKIKL